jgi:hypothetical protein
MAWAAGRFPAKDTKNASCLRTTALRARVLDDSGFLRNDRRLGQDQALRGIGASPTFRTSHLIIVDI